METTTVAPADDAPADEHTPWLTAEEQRLWRVYLEVNTLLDYQLGRELQPFGIAINDYEILVNLSEAPLHRMRMTDLATATLQSKSRLSHQITRMEQAGLVVREFCPSDRRGLFAVLTDAGFETLKKVAPSHVHSVREHFIDRLDGDQVTALQDALAVVAGHLREARGRT